MAKAGRHTGSSQSGVTRTPDYVTLPGTRLHLAGADSDLIVDGDIDVEGDDISPDTVEVHWRSQNVSDWRQFVMSTDGTVTGTTLTVVDGTAWIYGTGGSAATSNRRDLYLMPGTSRWEDMEVTGLWWGGPVQVDPSQPQHGFGLRTQIDEQGKQRVVMVWHDSAFGFPQLFNVGVWAANVGGGGFALPTGVGVDAGARTVTAGSRTSGLSTLTVGANHRLEVGQLVTVAVADAAYNGSFPVEAVGATTVSYRQAAAGDDPASGTGTATVYNTGLGGPTDNLVRQYNSTDASRTNNVVTATGLPTDHPFAVGDRIRANYVFGDTTYTGDFRIHAVADTTVSWVQVAANDASGGFGVLSKIFPYVVRARLVGNSAELAYWPYQGHAPATPALVGEAAFGDPQWSQAFDLSSLSGDGRAPTGCGGVSILGGHVGSTLDGAGNPTRRCQYSWITARRL